MKILVFTEGTILLPKFAEGLSREEVVRLNEKEVQERKRLAPLYKSNYDIPVDPNSAHDFANYIPHGNSVEKLKRWQSQGVEILYISSREVDFELDAIRNVLAKYDFPSAENLYYRLPGEEYKDVAERLMPNILIEDDCESIGGEDEMVYPHINPEIREKIKLVVVKEFAGIDHLPDQLQDLLAFGKSLFFE